jgi:general secretion pathway protein B
MSSILKALKKLEQEKARRDLPPDLNREIVQSRSGSRGPAWRIPTALAGTAVVAVVTTYAAMGGFSSKKGEPSAAAPRPTTPQAPSAVPVAPAQARPVVSAAAASAAPAPNVQAVPSAAAAPTLHVRREPAPPVKPSVTPRVPKQKRAQDIPAIPVVSTPPPPSFEAPRPVPAAAPKMTVSGIAYQKNGVLRLAVVNGGAVKEGSEVDGARIEEILPDRVRFVRDGRKFDVFIEKSDR